jgi:hypothetical protein
MSELDVDSKTLKEAVAAVGSGVDKVREHLVYRHFQHLVATGKAARRPARRAGR